MKTRLRIYLRRWFIPRAEYNALMNEAISASFRLHIARFDLRRAREELADAYAEIERLAAAQPERDATAETAAQLDLPTAI